MNLDPRERVVAALGTRVIQEQQEELMAEAWEQAGEIAQVNQRLRQMQLSLAISGRLLHHVAPRAKRIEDDDTLWRFAAPAQARLVMCAVAGAGHRGARCCDAGVCSTPQVVTSAAMRWLSRPRGADQPPRRDRACAWRLLCATAGGDADDRDDRSTAASVRLRCASTRPSHD